jgi:hypothetical protein
MRLNAVGQVDAENGNDRKMKKELAWSVALLTAFVNSPAGAECDETFVIANSIFIHATVECKRDYMDTPAGYYALAMTRQCSQMGEDKLTAVFKKAVSQFDEIKREKGKNAACAWVDKLERAIVQDVSK